MREENVALVKRWFEEVWNQRRTDTIEELLAEDAVCSSAGVPFHGPAEFIEKLHTPLLQAFPDLRAELESMVADEEQVVVRWVVRGLHRGDGLGIKASGLNVEFRGMTWLRCEEGKITKGWDAWNRGDLLAALAKPCSVEGDSISV